MLFEYKIDESTKEKRIRANLKKQKFYDVWAAILGMLGWAWELAQCFSYFAQISQAEKTLVVIHQLEGGFYSQLKYEIKLVKDLLYTHNRDESTGLMLLRIFVSISTAALLVCVYLSYEYELRILLLHENFYKKIMPGPHWVSQEKRLKQKRRIWLLLELIYLSVHSLPGVNMNFAVGNQNYYLEYSLDMIIFILMQGRMYLLFRLVKHFSPWLDYDASVVCKSQGATGGYSFGYRALLKERTFTFVMFLAIINTIIGSLAMMILERPYQFTTGQNWDNYLSALWCGFSLLTSVGYGDCYPATHAGRSAGLVIIMAGQFLSSLIVTGFSTLFTFEKNEEHAYQKIKEAIHREEFIEANRRAIKYALLYFLDVKIRKNRSANHHEHYKQLQLTLEHCRNARRALKQEERTRPFNFLIDIKKQELSEKKFEVIKAIRKVEAFINRLGELEKSMEIAEQAVSSLHQYNSTIYEALEAVKAETTVTQPFDGLVACPKALRHIDKLKKKLKKPAWMINAEPRFSIKDLEADKILLNYEKGLRRRLVKRLANAQTVVDKELVSLTSDKHLPTLSFHEKRELKHIENAKENLKRYVEQKKRKSEKSNKKSYISGPQLMERLRKKANLVKISLRMRSEAMRRLAKAFGEDMSNSSSLIDGSSERNSQSMSKSDPTTDNTGVDPRKMSYNGSSGRLPQDKEKENVLDLLKEEDEDSVLDSALDGSSFSDVRNTGMDSLPSSMESNIVIEAPRKTVLKPSKYKEMAEMNAKRTQSEKKMLPVAQQQQQSLSSFGIVAKQMKKVQSEKTYGDLESPGIMGDFNKMLKEAEQSRQQLDKGQERKGSPSMVTLDKLLESNGQELRRVSDTTGQEKEETTNPADTNATLITGGTQDNDILSKDSAKEISRQFSSIGESQFGMRRFTEDEVMDSGMMDRRNMRFYSHFSGNGSPTKKPGQQQVSMGRFSKYSDGILGNGSKSNTSLAQEQGKKEVSLMLGLVKKHSDSVGDQSELEWSPALKKRTVDPNKKMSCMTNMRVTGGTESSQERIRSNFGGSGTSEEGPDSNVQSASSTLNAKERDRTKSLLAYFKNVKNQLKG